MKHKVVVILALLVLVGLLFLSAATLAVDFGPSDSVTPQRGFGGY